jgi:hypothetical protein
MAVRAQNCTKEYLTSIPLPEQTETYTVISHEFIIKHTLEQLSLHGFVVQDEKYKANADGNIAQGIYYITYDKDPEMGLMFAWGNSYNKQIKFKCSIGGYVYMSNNSILSGDIGTYIRKHTGTADIETVNSIIDQISKADQFFDKLIADKTAMQNIIVTERKQAEMLGVLYAEYEILSTEQVSVVKQELDKPSYDYKVNTDSLWVFYNHVAHALKRSHPRNWMEDQRKLHLFISMEFDLLNYSEEVEEVVVEDPLLINYGEPENQLNILTEIEKAEVEADLVQAIEEREEAEKDVVWYEDPRYAVGNGLLYEDPAGNTFETLLLDDIKIHIESDPEYNARVAAIEGEPELELPTTDQIIFEGLRAADEAKAEKKELELKRVAAELKASAPEAFEKLENDLIKIEQELVFGDSIKVMDEVEEVKPTETKVVDDWNDFDLDFDNDDKKDTLGGEFFL